MPYRIGIQADSLSIRRGPGIFDGVIRVELNGFTSVSHWNIVSRQEMPTVCVGQFFIDHGPDVGDGFTQHIFEHWRSVGRVIKSDVVCRNWDVDSAKDGQVRAGVFESTVGVNHSIKGETWEFCLILSGVVEITEQGQSPVTYRAGDCFIMKPGYHGRFVRIDVTEESGLSEWLTELGLPCVGHALAMARGNPTPARSADASAHLFALSNQSFG